MSDTVFTAQARARELFALHGLATPVPEFNEAPTAYRARLVQHAQKLLPNSHPWSGIDVSRQPLRALDAIERSVIDDSIARFKQPRGPLREVSETCPRTGRTTVKFFGDPEHTWAPFKMKPMRASFATGIGRGADSVQARAQAAERAHALEVGRQVLAAAQQ